MTGIGDELERLATISTTMQRDVSPEDDKWFREHPLRHALSERGIITVAPVAAAVIEWLVERPLDDLAEDLARTAGRHNLKLSGLHLEPPGDFTVRSDMIWLIAPDHDCAPQVGKQRRLWGLQAPLEGWTIPPTFECDEELARHVAANDDDFTVVTCLVTSYEDGRSPWVPADDIPDPGGVGDWQIGPPDTHMKGPAT